MSIEYTNRLPPYPYTPAFESYLYNRESFLRLKNYPIVSFYAIDHPQQRLLARIHFSPQPLANGQLRAISLPELPFGSLEYDPETSSELINTFITYVHKQLSRQGITSVEIRDCIPEYRTDQGRRLEHSLLTQGFQVVEQTANHYIPVDMVSFREKIHPMEVRRLKKCLRAGFTFCREPLSKLPSVYRFIQECRAAKGWTLSLSQKELDHMTDLLPDAYALFAVYDRQQIVAATLGTWVNDRIFYHFYPASHPDYQSFSPMVYLLQQVYAYCCQTSATLIDLGTSVSSSLAAFKAHIGGRLSYKKTYLREI